MRVQRVAQLQRGRRHAGAVLDVAVVERQRERAQVEFGHVAAVAARGRRGHAGQALLNEPARSLPERINRRIGFMKALPAASRFREEAFARVRHAPA